MKGWFQEVLLEVNRKSQRQHGRKVGKKPRYVAGKIAAFNGDNPVGFLWFGYWGQVASVHHLPVGRRRSQMLRECRKPGFEKSRREM